MRKPKCADLFCGAGGAAMGLHRAGFEVEGWDIKPQPHYPFTFHLGNALDADLIGFDFVWASPPCQAFTNARVIHGRKHPDLLTPTREKLRAQSVPWIIENVPGAPMRPDVVLCGSQFGLRDGELGLIRHRQFEFWTPQYFLIPSCSHSKQTVSVFGHGGHIYHGVESWKRAMGIDWMTREELAQAIPPAYSEFLGRQILKIIKPQVPC